MSENIAKINQALETCEKAIRQVIAAAAQDGDYEAVGRGRDVALRINAFRSGPGSTAHRPNGVSEWATHKSPSTLKGTRLAKSSEYPRFELMENNLVRYGWSKREKREYSHKAPKSVFDQVISAMTKIGSTDGGPHTAEAIIEQANQDLEDSIPNYQVYAILGFLKAANAIEQQGREGYLIPADFANRAHQCWS